MALFEQSPEQSRPLADEPAGRNWWLWVAVALAGVVVFALTTGDSGCTSSSTRSTSQADAGVDGKDLFDSATDTLDRLEQFDTEPALRLVIERLNQWLEIEAPKPGWKIDPLVARLPDDPPGLRDIQAVQTAGALRFPADDGTHLMEVNWLRNVAVAARGSKADELSRAQSLFDWTVRNIQLEDYPFRFKDTKVKTGAPLVARDVLLFGRGDYLQRAWVFMLLARQDNLQVVMLATPDTRRASGLRPLLPALLHDGELYLFDSQLGLPIPGPDGKDVATLAQVIADDGLLRALDLPDKRYRLKSEDLTQLAALIEASPGYLARRMEIVESRLAGSRRMVMSVDASALAKQLEGIKHIKEVGLWSHPYEVLREREKLAPEEWAPFRSEMVPFLVQFPTAQRSSDDRRPTQSEHPLFMAGVQEVEGTVVSLAGTTLVIVDPQKNQHTYQVDDTVPVRINDKPARLVDLKVTTPVRVSVNKQRDVVSVESIGQPGDKAVATEQTPLNYQSCSLWMGRVLQFKGNETSPRPLGVASTHFREVRVSDHQLAGVIDRFVVMAMRSDRRLAEAFQRDPRLERGFRENLEAAIPMATDHASYWLGLIAYERGKYPVAIDYFQKRTLERSPDGPWTSGARYNLARSLEAQALAAKPDEAQPLLDQAIELLEGDDSSQEHGNKLRARRLRQKSAGETAAP